MYNYQQGMTQMNYTPNYAANYPRPMMEYQTQQMQQPAMIFRPVASEEEARAVATDFGGATTIMPDFAHGRIYTKAINFANGAPVMRTFIEQAAQEPVHAQQGVQYAPMELVEQMRQEMEQMRKTIAQMTEKGADSE